MSSWKNNFIDAYRLATIPYRAIQMNRRRKAGRVPVLSLFYHRVADTEPNEWSISCAEFERQIDWLEQHFQIVDLEESQRRINSGSNESPTISITFDDGYAENCDFALPMLIERRIPVTYFVSTHFVVNQEPFPHDALAGAPLPVNSIESLRALDLSGVEIGAHARSHVDLGQVTDPDILFDEVIKASRDLEKLIGKKVRYFAFPFGRTENLNARVFRMLKEEGFLGVCSTLGGINEIGGDAFHISRLHGDPNFSRMQNWLTFDPRLVAPRYDYESAGPDSAKKPEHKSSLFPSVGIGNTSTTNKMPQD